MGPARIIPAFQDTLHYCFVAYCKITSNSNGNLNKCCSRPVPCLQADMLGSMKAGSPGDSPEVRGAMSRGASGALSERMVPRANSNGCASALGPLLRMTLTEVLGISGLGIGIP